MRKEKNARKENKFPLLRKELSSEGSDSKPPHALRMQPYELLREMAARYRALFDSSSYCIYLHDLDGRFVDANDAALNLLGYDRRDLGSLTISSLLDVDQLSEANAAIEELKRLGTSKKPKEYGLKTKLGDTIWLETDAAMIYREGKPYAIQGVAKNITARKRAEEALRESETKYRTLFDDSRDAIYITSREGAFIAANHALLELFGYSEKQLMRHDVRDLYADPHDREIFQSKIETEGSVKNYPVKFRKKNGEEMECLLTATVRKSGRGEILGYQGIIRDITEQKRVEKTLVESEARYRAIVEAFDGLVYICSADYRVEFMNTRLVERTGHDGTGDLCYKALHNLDTICPWCVNERVFKGETVRWEVRSPKDDRWWYAVNTPIYHEDGSMSKQSMILDITERKKMEEELKESSESIKLFAYSVSHDLKNPAISVYAFAKRMRERYAEILDKRGQNYCERILAASEQIADLVDQINVFISAKEVPLTIENVNLRDMLKMCREEFSTQLGSRQVKWRETGDMPSIQADRISISRILRNLVDNSLKYGGEDLTEINIGYVKNDEFHVLCVEDDGIGIKEEDSKKVFDLFIRKKSSKGIQGTGLGLAIVKEIAERHGGRVWAKPAAKKGISFFVALPKN